MSAPDTDAPAVRITGMKICEAGPWHRGKRHVAYFDVEVPGVAVQGGALFVTRSGHFWGNLPRLSATRGVRFTDKALACAVREAAGAAYLAIGGTIPEDTGLADDSEIN